MPREFGVTKHPLFFLDFLKWRMGEKGRDGASNLSDETVRRMDVNEDIAEEREKVTQNQNQAPLRVEGLSKKYPGATGQEYALNDFFLMVDSGECFGLLGKNGAGKSTAISLLTGLYPPSDGTAWVAGHNIISQMDKARYEIGVCPQFCILWDELSIKDHLLFYSRLKGVPKDMEKNHVSEWLHKLGLSFAADRKAAMLSGGMKRRLSVGIALVGNSKVIFLDEPTTGLDPENKHQMWKILEQVKHGKAIILTTHSMTEAEVLSTRIGIMAKGTMKCIGTPQHLKNSVGNLLSLKIRFIPENDTEIENYVTTYLPSSHKVHSFQGAVEFHFPQSSVLVSEIYAIMEAGKERGVIEEWSVSPVGLEEVFHRIVEAN